MAAIDLHVHSHFSSHPSEWFLQRLGTRESYTDPETVYQVAKSRGMTLVTITDHNEIAGSLMLQKKYPQQVITGVEVTTYFPDNSCKIHLLVYGLDESQFQMINRVRSDIYQLRDYIKEQHLAHAVAHPTFSINKKLDVAYLERLFLLFDYFEGINGSRSRLGNEVLMKTLAVLTPEKIDDLHRKYHIEPYSDTPWDKGVIGGSDDHSGLFIGKTYTCAAAETPAAFLEQLRKKEVSAHGRHNDYRGLAFAIYRIAYEFSKTRSKALAPSLFHTLNQLVFEKQSMKLKDRLVLEKMKYSKGAKDDTVKCLIVELMDTFKKNENLSIEAKLDCAYENISKIADEFFRLFIAGIAHDLHQGDIIGLIKRISGSIPSIFLSLPFFSTINLLNESRSMLSELTKAYTHKRQWKGRTILWFTDDQGEGAHASRFFSSMEECINDEVILVTTRSAACSVEESISILPLPSLYSYTPPWDLGYTCEFPSLLTSLKLISEASPDEIVLSTPGPTGVLGLLAARLLHVRTYGKYLRINYLF
jgi:hypothetical protein